MAMSKEDKKKARETADKILEAFDWEKTKEGVIFWDDFHDRLIIIAQKRR